MRMACRTRKAGDQATISTTTSLAHQGNGIEGFLPRTSLLQIVRNCGVAWFVLR
jgi:hypothetical protein